MSIAIKVIGVVIVAVIAICIALYLFAKGLINPQPPIPTGSEKARFLRALTCSYAMCARDGCDSIIIDIGSLDKQNEVSCYDICNAWEKNGKKGYKCGSDFKIGFTFDDSVTYNADTQSTWNLIYHGIETDITRYRQSYWYYYINNDAYCFSRSAGSLTTCAYEHGPIGFFPEGKCEGVIENTTNDCQRLVAGENSLKENTGHIWVGPDINNNVIAQCTELGINGLLDNPLYAKCTFNKGQSIYIWTEGDKKDEPWWNGGVHYCPELILCSS
jgi:hypothetical protein